MKRKDGTRYRGADMLYTIVPFIMVKRSDACNALTVHLPYNSMHDYIAAKRAQGVNLSYMTLFIAAYVRTVAKYPALNRFIVNKRIYSRNSLTVAMVVQRADGAEGTMSKLDFELTDTVFDVNRKIYGVCKRQPRGGYQRYRRHHAPAYRPYVAYALCHRSAEMGG